MRIYISKRIEDIFNSFEYIVNSVEDIFKSLEDILNSLAMNL